MFPVQKASSGQPWTGYSCCSRLDCSLFGDGGQQSGRQTMEMVREQPEASSGQLGVPLCMSREIWGWWGGIQPGHSLFVRPNGGQEGRGQTQFELFKGYLPCITIELCYTWHAAPCLHVPCILHPACCILHTYRTYRL